MNLYLLMQDQIVDYDTYDSIIVCAENETDAKRIGPNGEIIPEIDPENISPDYWATSAEHVDCKFIGIAANDIPKNSVVLASFNAG